MSQVPQPSTLPPLVRGEWVPTAHEEFLAWAPKGIVYLSACDRHQAVIGLVCAVLDRLARLLR